MFSGLGLELFGGFEIIQSPSTFDLDKVEAAVNGYFRDSVAVLD